MLFRIGVFLVLVAVLLLGPFAGQAQAHGLRVSLKVQLPANWAESTVLQDKAEAVSAQAGCGTYCCSATGCSAAVMNPPHPTIVVVALADRFAFSAHSPVQTVATREVEMPARILIRQSPRHHSSADSGILKRQQALVANGGKVPWQVKFRRLLFDHPDILRCGETVFPNVVCSFSGWADSISSSGNVRAAHQPVRDRALADDAEKVANLQLPEVRSDANDFASEGGYGIESPR